MRSIDEHAAAAVAPLIVSARRLPPEARLTESCYSARTPVPWRGNTQLPPPHWRGYDEPRSPAAGGRLTAARLEVREMHRHPWIALLSMAVLASVLAGCSPPVPTCPTDELLAPNLTSPADGVVVTTPLPTLHWTYPANCSPEGYRIDLSVTSDFSDTSLSGGPGDHPP